MYEPKVKQTKWKKPSVMLAKKKFGIPSKHKKINPPRDTFTEVSRILFLPESIKYK